MEMTQSKLVSSYLKNEFREILFQMKKKFFVIVDDNIDRLYRATIQEELSSLELSWVVIPSGEGTKTREMKHFIEDRLFELGIRPDHALIALGGGVITDLVGFVAATLYRGIPYINIPTTLLGMVDASIGGKTGVNTSFGKNSVGAFHLPLHIYREPRFLETLPEQELLMGIAEMIKYGLILDFELFERLEAKERINFELIERSALIKEKVVSMDFREAGYRQILNFGHTVAHALEHMTHYELPHGFAVGMGLLIETYLSYLEGHISYEEVERLRSLLKAYEFPIMPIHRELFYESVIHDKKNRSQEIHFVMIERIGQHLAHEGKYSFPVKRENIDKALEIVWNTASLKVH